MFVHPSSKLPFEENFEASAADVKHVPQEIKAQNRAPCRFACRWSADYSF